MTKLTGNHSQHLKKPTATGLVLVVVLAGLPSCALQPRTDWSRVQAVPPPQKTEVRLYKDAAPQESQRIKIKGRFESATDDSITLRLKDGLTRTVEKQAVRRILTYRPYVKRWPGWVATGIAAVFFGLPWDSGNGRFLFIPLVGGGFFIGTAMGPIYNVPRKHRIRPQVDQQSGDQDNISGKQEEPSRPNG